MTKEEKVDRVVQTLLKRGFSKYEATRIANEVIRNLTAYSMIQDQREARFAALIKNQR